MYQPHKISHYEDYASVHKQYYITHRLTVLTTTDTAGDGGICLCRLGGMVGPRLSERARNPVDPAGRADQYSAFAEFYVVVRKKLTGK